MWVFEEYVKQEGDKWVRPARGAKPPEGKTWVDEGYTPLTQVINEKHENVIYLPGIPLPTSIVAQPDIKEAVTGATMMIFVIPHNFLAPIVPKMEARPALAPPSRPNRPRHSQSCHHPSSNVITSRACHPGRLRPGCGRHLADQGH